MLNLNTRFFRYVSTWAWIILYNARLYPSLLFFTVLFGVTARLSTIVGFVLSITIVGFVLSVKSAIWIFQPQTIPQTFYNYLPVSQQTMFGIMILVPGIIFFITGFLQYFHSNNALELQTKFSNHFSQRSILNKLLRKTSTELSEKTTFVKAASSLRKTHAKLFTVQAMLLEFLVLVPVIFISLSVGLYINWIIVTVIIGLGAIFVTIFIWKRHQDRNKLEEADVELRKEQANALSQLVNLHSETNIETQQSTLKLDPSPRLESMTRSISSIKHAHQKFKFNSNLTMDTGQSMIVIIFLTLLLSTDVQNMETQYLVILALLFRFIISYGKAIIQVILKLSPFYKFVVDFQKSLGES